MTNTEDFREAALTFQEKGYYTNHKSGTLGSYRYWSEQAKRCVHGYKKPGDIWIPGYMYWYLNFTPIKLTQSNEDDGDLNKRVQASRVSGFPEFRDGVYDYYMYLDEAEKNGEHAVLFKTRGVGFSFMSASMCNRNFFLLPGSTSFVFAESTEYLTGDGILTKAWDMMSFVDQNTAWSKRRQVKNDAFHKRASRKVKIDGLDTEKGFLSEIVGVPIGNDIDKTVRGKRGKLIVWEESGSNKLLLKGWNIATQSMAEGRYTFGLQLCGGCVCAGTKVHNKNGKEYNIEDLPTNTGILGFDGDNLSLEDITYWQKPTKKPCYRITTITGRYLECSNDHPIMLHQNWKSYGISNHSEEVKGLKYSGIGNLYYRRYFIETDKLSKGELVVICDINNKVHLESIDKIEYIGIKDVYNLTANNTHTYIANGIVTHNTGGSDKSDMMSIETLFKKPKAYRVHAVPNIWETGHENEMTGFFWPACKARKGHMDKDGNSNIISATEEILYNRKKMAQEGDPDSLIQLIAEEPLKPSEAMLRINRSIFNLNLLRERLSELETNKSIIDSIHIGRFDIVEGGDIKWVDDRNMVPIWDYPINNTTNLDGAVMIFEHPVRNDDGIIPYGVYIASTDPYDDDKTDITKRDSLGSTFVMNRLTGRIVAEYTARPRYARDFYETTRRLLKYYNATCNYEQNKKGMFAYFDNMNSTYMLCDMPKILRDQDLIKGEYSANRQKGTYVNEEVAKFGRELLKTYLEQQAYGEEEGSSVTNTHLIKSPATLSELIYWEPDRNADRVSSLLLLMIYKMDMAKIEIDLKKKVVNLAEDPFFDRLWTGRIDHSIGQSDSYNRLPFFDEIKGVFDLDR